MKNEVDYIVVGLGIAGISICEQLKRHHKTFVVFDDGVNAASEISGGVFNPVILKRFHPVWRAKACLEVAIPFYELIGREIRIPLIEKIDVLRVFSSVEEQNDWTVASDKTGLHGFLSSEFQQNTNPNIHAPFGFGKVNGSGRVDVDSLISEMRKSLQKTNQLQIEKFNYNLVIQKENLIFYKNFTAKKIIFAEGIAAVRNPFAPKHFLIGNKGEYLIIKAPELHVNDILKGPVFIIPLGNHFYKVGATYAPEEYSYEPTKTARRQLEIKLKKMIRCHFEITDQIAGVRPTTHDRHPRLGSLSENKAMVFFNGLGTHGIMMAPLLSNLLYQFMENETPLPKEVNINRKLKIKI